MTPRPLRIVKDDAPAPCAEAQLRALFRREREIRQEAQQVAADIAIERRRYADAHGLITPPRVEQLRAEFGE